MPAAAKRINITLDAADPDASHVHMILESIPGALDRAYAGLEQAKAGDVVPIDEV